MARPFYPIPGGRSLKVAELSAFTWPRYIAGRDLYEGVMQSPVDLAEELVRGSRSCA